MIINKNSWHYKLATIGNTPWWDDTDICTYRWEVIKGGFLMIVAAHAVALATVAVGDFAAWFLACVMSLTLVSPDIGAGIILACIIVIAAAFSMWLIFERGALGKVFDVPVVKEMYTSWKDKYCVPVEFK